MILNLGTGTFHKLKLSLKEQRDVVAQLDIDGLELCMAVEEEMDEIIQDREHVTFLQKFDGNTLHAPFKNGYIITRKNRKEKLDKIISFARLIKARNVVFHLYNIQDISVLQDFPLPYTLENTLTGDWHGEKLVQFFEQHPDMRMTLDTSHCWHFSYDEFLLLSGKIQKQIAHVHLSQIIEGKHHKQFIHKGGIEQLRSTFEHLPNAIITIEENFDDISDILPEVDLIRKVVARA